MLKDADQRYGWISIALHWFSAIAIIYLYLTGEELEELARGPERTDVQLMHVSIGMIALLPVLYRLYWRWASDTPEPLGDNRILSLLATWVPVLMLLAVFVLMVTGVLIPWSVGNPLDVFDWFQIPSPLPSSRPFHQLLEEIHEFAAHAIVPLFLLHVLGALKHVVIDRDNTLTRMLWTKRDG